MFSIVFFTVLIGCFIAVMIGTLGDELHHFALRILDRFHRTDSADQQLRSLYQKTVTRHARTD